MINNEQDFKAISYEDICRFKKCKKNVKFNIHQISIDEYEDFERDLDACIKILNNRNYIEDYSEIINRCFQLGCYILYNRNILNEVIEKQKKYEVDYVVDFLKYVLRIFFRKYSTMPLLTKSQCDDIKELCSELLKISNSENKHRRILERLSSKEVADCLMKMIV